MFIDPRALKLYVDGSALKNPGGPGGLAGIVEFHEEMNRENEVIFEEGYLATTNNRMEIYKWKNLDGRPVENPDLWNVMESDIPARRHR